MNSHTKKQDISPVQSCIQTFAKPIDPPTDIGFVANWLAPYFPKDLAYVVAYLDYAVLIGYYSQGDFRFCSSQTWKPPYIQRLRVFTPAQEVLLWRTGKEYKSRQRIDYGTEGNEHNIMDVYQALFGTASESLSDSRFSRLYEERGTELFLPFQNLSVEPPQKRIFLKVRNYIGFNDVHQATYEDSRLIGFYTHDNQLLEVSQ